MTDQVLQSRAKLVQPAAGRLSAEFRRPGSGETVLIVSAILVLRCPGRGAAGDAEPSGAAPQSRDPRCRVIGPRLAAHRFTLAHPGTKRPFRRSTSTSATYSSQPFARACDAFGVDSRTTVSGNILQ